MTRPVLIVVTLLTLTACGGTKAPTATPHLESSAGSSTPAVVSSGATPPTSAAAPKPSAATPTTGGGQQTSPKIEYFRIKTKPSCPSSGPGASFPGNDIVLEWKVTGGPTQVTISIDGPGIFGTYDATFEHAFPFACPAPNGPASGTIQKHKYTLKTVGGTVRQAELTGEARVN